jgi:hypothetical protein
MEIHICELGPNYFISDEYFKISGNDLQEKFEVKLSLSNSFEIPFES